MAGDSMVSNSTIDERAEKLTEPKPVEAAPAEVKETALEAKPVVEEKRAPVTNEEQRRKDDPKELLKWNTKVSQELAELKKQLQTLAENLTKTSKQKVDWKELAKDPAKLEEAIKAERGDWEKQINDSKFESTREITHLENERRKHDPAYPRWEELQPLIIKLATTADSRVNFNQHPTKALDEMYAIALEVADQDPTLKKAIAPAGPKTYTEEELNTRIEDARAKALAEAQKGLAAETAAGGVGSMGKSATKGKGGTDKEALKNMPLNDLKRALINASTQ